MSTKFFFLPLAFVLSTSAAAQDDASEEKSGTIPCGEAGTAMLHANTNSMALTSLSFTVNCPGNWTPVKIDANGGEIALASCPIVTNGGSGSCSPTLSANEQLHIRVTQGTATGAGVTWKLVVN